MTVYQVKIFFILKIILKITKKKIKMLVELIQSFNTFAELSKLTESIWLKDDCSQSLKFLYAKDHLEYHRKMRDFEKVKPNLDN